MHLREHDIYYPHGSILYHAHVNGTLDGNAIGQPRFDILFNGTRVDTVATTAIGRDAILVPVRIGIWIIGLVTRQNRLTCLTLCARIRTHCQDRKCGHPRKGRGRKFSQ